MSHSSSWICIIRHLSLLLLCGFALSVVGNTPTNSKSPDQKILILGDSLSAAYGIKTEQGWVELLRKRLSTDHYTSQVINASISGETSGGGLARLEALLEKHQPHLLIIELGANDGLRGFPTKLIKANLEAAILLGEKYHAQVMLIGVQIPVNYGPRYTSSFEDIFAELAKKYQLPLLPSLMGEIPLQQTLMQKDGLHPTAEAQPLILDRVWPVLKPLLKK